MRRSIALVSKSTRLDVSLGNEDCEFSISDDHTALLFKPANNDIISDIYLTLSSSAQEKIQYYKIPCFSRGRMGSVRIDALYPTVFGEDTVIDRCPDHIATEGYNQFKLRVLLRFDTKLYSPVPKRIGTVSLIVGESTVAGSKEVIGLNSGFFFALFYGDFGEKNSGSYCIREVHEKRFIWLIDSLMRRKYKVNSVDQALCEMSLADRFCMQIVHVRLLQYLKSVNRIPPLSDLKSYVDLATTCRDNGELLRWMFEKCRSSADLTELIREVGPTLTAPHLTTFFQFLATKQSDEKRMSEEEKSRNEEKMKRSVEERKRSEEKLKRSEEERNSLIKEVARLQQSKSLAVVPSTATLPASGGKSTHTLFNSGNCKIMYQIASTNWREYESHSNCRFIEAGQTAKFDLIRKAGPANVDDFFIQYMPAPVGATNAFEAFKGKTPSGEVKLSVKAE